MDFVYYLSPFDRVSGKGRVNPNFLLGLEVGSTASSLAVRRARRWPLHHIALSFTAPSSIKRNVRETSPVKTAVGRRP
eukprot:scaffold28917_cov132-Isochrysis_galbana.AAC.1